MDDTARLAALRQPIGDHEGQIHNLQRQLATAQEQARDQARAEVQGEVRFLRSDAAHWKLSAEGWIAAVAALMEDNDTLRQQVTVARAAVVAELRDLAGEPLTNLCDRYGGTTGDVVQEVLLNRAHDLEDDATRGALAAQREELEDLRIENAQLRAEAAAVETRTEWGIQYGPNDVEDYEGFESHARGAAAEPDHFGVLVSHEIRIGPWREVKA
jgi:cell division protein FtsB